MGSPKKPCCLTVKFLQHRYEGSLMLKSTRLLQYMIPKHVIVYMIYTQGSNFRAGFLSTLLHVNSLNHNLISPEIQDYLVHIQSRGGGRGQGVTYVTFSKSKL